MPTLLIKNGAVLTMDEQNRIHSPGWVWIEADRVKAVGSGQPPTGLAAQTKRTIDASHMAVLPGLVNAHTHLSQSFMRGLADDKPLLEWLKRIMWPVQAAMSAEDVRLASLLGLVENLRCGVTAVVQHHKIITSPDHVEAAAHAARTVGLRMRLARGWVDLDGAKEAPETLIDEMTRLYERWHNSAEGRLTVAFGPMVPWRCSDLTMHRTISQARIWGIPTHIHVAETRGEIELLQERTGLRHIEWLHSLEALGPDVQLVHCVWLDERELDLIAASGSTVIHCPISNMYLASGIAPVRQMLDRGIPVALGTDGSASHNSQDLLETLKVAALLTKVSSGQATALSPAKALRMVTVDAAPLLGQAYTGQLVPGAKADLTLVDLNTARSMPVHRADSALVYNASGPDVNTVIVDGQILLDNGRVSMLDEASLLADCRQATRQLLKRAGVAGT